MHQNETIKVRTESGQTLEVVVTSLKADAIWILVGEGAHSLKCKLEPTRNGLAYAGSLMGRELIYERSAKEVRDEISKAARNEPAYRWKK